MKPGLDDDILEWLQEWYLGQCDRKWEHDQGIDIRSTSQPGWSIAINLRGTEQENIKFGAVNVNRGPDDWFFCTIQQKDFVATCSPSRLKKVIEVFRNWVLFKGDKEAPCEIGLNLKRLTMTRDQLSLIKDTVTTFTVREKVERAIEGDAPWRCNCYPIKLSPDEIDDMIDQLTDAFIVRGVDKEGIPNKFGHLIESMIKHLTS